MTILERPLRGMTMQGPRVSLQMSEMIPAGAVLKFQIETFSTAKTNVTETMLRAVLDYGQRIGYGQWRNSGEYGQFEYELSPAR